MAYTLLVPFSFTVHGHLFKAVDFFSASKMGIIVSMLLDAPSARLVF